MPTEGQATETLTPEGAQQRIQASMPLAVADEARQRIAKIERDNPRLFEPLEDDDG